MKPADKKHFGQLLKIPYCTKKKEKKMNEPPRLPGHKPIKSSPNLQANGSKDTNLSCEITTPHNPTP